jgi:hypothetical protein
MFATNYHINQKNVKFIAIFLFTLVILFIFTSGCIEAAENSGESVVQAGGSGSASDVVAPAVAFVINAINSNTPGSGSPISIVDEMRIVHYNHMVSYLLAGDQGYQFNIEIATDGAPVDVLVLDESDYQLYSNAFKQGSAVSFSGVIYKFVVSKNFQYVLPSQGRYYLAIENSPFLNGGADAKRDVNVSINVELIK